MSIDGSYKYIQVTPLGSIEGEITLKAEGNTLTGRATSPYGTGDIRNGKVDGNKLNWILKADIPGPMGEMNITVSATFDGDRIEGESRMEAFPPNKFIANRL